MNQCGETLREAHLPFLDGFRAIAANWVLAAHIMIWGGWYGIPVPDPKIAVELFMVLSGFLMLHLSESRSLADPPGIRFTLFFWLRRFFRIAPLYYFVLLLAVLLGPQIEQGGRALQEANPKFWKDSAYSGFTLDHSVTSLLLHLTFLFGLFPQFSSCVGLPDWSIGLEVQFYAVFPLMWWAFRRFGSLLASLVSVWCAEECRQVFAGVSFVEPSFLPLKLDVFIVGMLLSSAVRHHASRSPSALLEFLIAVWLAASHSHLLAALCLAIGCCCLSFANTEPLTRIPAGILTRCLENRVTSFLARVSYSVYLLHGFFISIFGGWIVRDQYFGQLRPVFRTGILGVITVTLTYATAWLCHVLLERPGVLLGRKLGEMVGGRKLQLPGKVA